MPAGGFLFGECTTTKIAKPKDDMNAGYISAFAALAGSLIGGLTTFCGSMGYAASAGECTVALARKDETARALPAIH
jgi:hypothetical protein